MQDFFTLQQNNCKATEFFLADRRGDCLTESFTEATFSGPAGVRRQPCRASLQTF